MQIIKIINLILAFSLELVMFFSIGYWGFQQGKTDITKWLIATACFVLAVGLWAIFAAPKSTYRIKFPYRILFEACMFTICSVALYKTGHSRFSIIFTIAFIVSEAIALLMPES
jgi:hypothetical protein